MTPDSFALIIGGMKCGTTSLFELLAQHPEISPCRVKEPDFFATASDPRADWPRYVELWDYDSSRHRVALEASTAYTKYPWVPGVPERIARAPEGASFRFIYMMREPVRRIESHVRHGLYDGWGRDLDEGLSDDLIDLSAYGRQIDRYMRFFPRERILLLTLEEFREAPDEVLRRVCEFLGVATDHVFRESEQPRNTGDFYTLPAPIAALARNPLAKAVVDVLLPRGARSRLRRALASFGSGDSARLGRWRLTEEEKRLVHASLAEDLRRLRDDYGVVAAWIPSAAGAPGPAE